MRAQPGKAEKTSVVDFAVLLVLCPLAGIGAGLALANALAGFAVAAIGLIAVLAYGVAANLGYWLRDRREESRRLSVTEISGRRRGVAARSPSPQPEEGPDIAKAAEPDRVVPLRMHVVR